MKILVAWDSEAEVDLISMYLGVADNEVTPAIGAGAFAEQVATGTVFDVVLTSMVAIFCSISSGSKGTRSL